MHPTLQTALTITALAAAWRYPARTRILGPYRKERDTDTSNHHRSPHAPPVPGSGWSERGQQHGTLP